MNPMKPANSPACWGMQYTDGDPECSQCPFKESCRPASISRAVNPQPQYQMPARPASLVPLPAKPYLPTVPAQGFRPTVAAPPPVPAAPQQMTSYPTPPPVAPYQTQSYQPMPQATIPDPNNPHPMVPMMRPGAAGPPYYFCQYPGERTVERLSKNMALRGAEAIFTELMFFFRHWTWPPRS